jgi:cell wall assembly regulator SMI1
MPINEAWGRLRTWFEANAEEAVAGLLPGATEAELVACESELGIPLPPELRALFAAVQGSEDTWGTFPSSDFLDDMAYGVLGVSGCLELWRQQKELLEGGDFEGQTPPASTRVQAVWWHPGWVPFAGNGGGDLFFIDTVPGDDGVVGQVVKHDHESGSHKVLATSLLEFITDLADEAHAGRLVWDEDYGLRQADTLLK